MEKSFEHLTIEINVGNEAFGETDQEAAVELARILRQLASRLESDMIVHNNLYDTNGNKVGQIVIE